MTIGIWGDSIVYGSCDQEGLGWVGRLRKNFPIDDYTAVYNRGVSGDTTENLLKRFSIEAESIRPDTIVFAIGINDSKYPTGEGESLVPLEDFKKNVRTLIEQARAYTENIFIISTTSVGDDAENMIPRFLNAQIQTYSSALKEIADEEQISFVDVSNALDMHTDLYDGLHPNAQGYEKLYRVISATCDFSQ
jgi:acyl-CoA thioesterase-1